MFAHDDYRSLADHDTMPPEKAAFDAAWEICRRDGLGALSLRDLGRSVGLKASSLYAYFDSKSAIDAMFLQGYLQLDQLSARWDMLVTSEHPRASFKLSFFDFCTSDPVRYQLMFQRVLPDFEPTPETYEVSVRQLERLGRRSPPWA